MHNISTFLYTILTLIWLMMATLILLRIANCNTIPNMSKMFVMVFFLLQILYNGFQMYKINHKSHITIVAPKRERAEVDKSAAKDINTFTSFNILFNLLSLVCTAILYYIVFQNVLRCSRTNLGDRLLLIFFVLTIIQQLSANAVKTSVDNTVMYSLL